VCYYGFEVIGMEHNTIITWGTTLEETECIQKNIPAKICAVDTAGDYLDIIVKYCFAIVINPLNVNAEELSCVLGHYDEIADCYEGKIIFTTSIELPKKIKKVSIIAESFQLFEQNIKYYLLAAYRKSKKAQAFSEALSNCIAISSMIRKRPGVTTHELAVKFEKSERTILRYIEAIRLAGESLDYDPVLKGWKLTYPESFLWDLGLKY